VIGVIVITITRRQCNRHGSAVVGREEGIVSREGKWLWCNGIVEGLTIVGRHGAGDGIIIEGKIGVCIWITHESLCWLWYNRIVEGWGITGGAEDRIATEGIRRRSKRMGSFIRQS
jgi:hypothetical protein